MAHGRASSRDRAGYGRAVDRLEGIAAADRHLGRPFPLPSCPLPLARWTEVALEGAGVALEWNLDDTRPGSPGRLCLYAGPSPPPDHLPGIPCAAEGAFVVRRAPLEEAEPSLRPVVELHWRLDGLHLRLTAQGPWHEKELRSIAASVGRTAGADTPRDQAAAPID